MRFTLGIFFDGTGNNLLDLPQQTISNVAKLFKVYGADGDDSVGKLYVRGVGSKKAAADRDSFGGENIFSKSIDELLGGAFGVGGHARIEHIITQARSMMEARPDVSDLTIDVFGFSRGAAMARHFVNTIHKTPLRLHLRQSIRFLGLFDTVGSFGIPGDNKDDFDFGVSNDQVRYIYQLVAENELRRNFDLHSIRKDPASPCQFDDSACSGDRWMVEILCPGVHSDIGGSYDQLPPDRNKLEHGNRNNLLSRVYLERMFHAAKNCGVPLANPSREDRQAFWAVDQKIKSMLSNILGYYKRSPELRVMHAILREAEACPEVLKDDLKKVNKLTSRRGRLRSNPDHRRLKEKIKAIEDVSLPALRKLMLTEGFGGDRRRHEAFLDNYLNFARNYMHTSHAPSNRTAGMEAESCSMSVNSLLWPSTVTNSSVAAMRETLKREVFYNTGL